MALGSALANQPPVDVACMPLPTFIIRRSQERYAKKGLNGPFGFVLPHFPSALDRLIQYQRYDSSVFDPWVLEPLQV
jgi:hypothetical protein